MSEAITGVQKNTDVTMIRGICSIVFWWAPKNHREYERDRIFSEWRFTLGAIKEESFLRSISFCFLGIHCEIEYSDMTE